MIGLYLCRQRPDFILSEVEGLPHSFPCSTIGPAGLNLRRLAGVNEPLTSGEWEPAAEVLSVAKDLHPARRNSGREKRNLVVK
jgi:hypothetical protein